MLRTFEERMIGEMTDHERSVVRHGAGWFFLVLFSYYILRPIREQISATYGIKNLEWLFFATFSAMLVAIPTFAFLVSRFDRKKLVPSIYGFFIVSLLGFWAAFRFTPDSALIGEVAAQEWIARVLFIWISVYGLFIVSFFWSVIGDMLSTEQGRRLFGFVMAGGTAGGMAASLVAGWLTENIGQVNLLFLPGIALGLSLFVYFDLERAHRTLGPQQDQSSIGQATGGNPFAGLTAVLGSHYLLAIAAFGFLLATCGTTIYFQQAEIVAEALTTDEAKTSFFARVNFCVQVLTILLQTLVVGRLMKWFGVGLTLAVLPLAYIFGITSLALAPTLTVLAVISVTGRAAEYAISNPAREVLFTAVNREDRYKAKSFIDTIVRRGGDAGIGSLYRQLRSSAGLAMTTLSWCVVPIAIGWLGLAIFIGRENKKISERVPAAESQ
ncbi:MAG: NTP/NDP exchange transporter [Planctomycetaceae bacterium]